jgi:AcrR family transcriptional regulator
MTQAQPAGGDGRAVRPRGRPRATPEEQARRRREIVEAAYAVFAQRGYHATTIGDIAAQMGTGNGTIYHYFKGKREILDQVIDYAVERFVGAAMGVMRVATTSDELLDLFQDTVRLVYDELAASPGLFRLLLFEATTIGDDVAGRVLRLPTQVRGAIAAYLGFARTRGILRADLDVDHVARLVYGAVLAGSLGLLEGDFGPDRRAEYMRTVVAVFADGIRG